MFGNKFKNSGQGFTPDDFSKLSSRFVRSLGVAFQSAEQHRLWPLSEDRNGILGRFWQSTAARYSPQATAWQPDQLSIEMMKEGDHLIGLLLLPTMRGSVGFSAGIWLFGPVDFSAEDSFGAAKARFFAMAEDKEAESDEARIYEIKDDNLVESGVMPGPDVSLFLDTIVGRYINGEMVATVKSGDPDMAAAMDEASAQVPYFLGILENYPAVQQYSVKIKLQDDEGAEYFWLENTRWEGGLFHGTLGNDPVRVKNAAYGQPITVGPDEVRDWYYLWEGKMRGNYTLRAGLPYMDPAQAAKMIALLDEI